MGSRELEYDENAVCDECGAKGATDFLGDFLCHKCARKCVESEPEERAVLMCPFLLIANFMGKEGYPDANCVEEDCAMWRLDGVCSVPGYCGLAGRKV